MREPRETPPEHYATQIDHNQPKLPNSHFFTLRHRLLHIVYHEAVKQ